MPTVLIGCRLPHGLTLTHPNPEIEDKVTLAGTWSNPLRKPDGSPAVDHVVTPVDAEFWEVWKKAYATYVPLRNGSIFEARSEQDAAAKMKDLRKVKTGFEPIHPESMGIKTLSKKD